MEGSRFLREITLKNLLSFGPSGVKVELQPLNVLVGLNGTGKSNFLEAISILQATPTDLTKPFRETGGISEWIWKGGTSSAQAEIETVLSYESDRMPIRYRLSFGQVGQRLEVLDEVVENEEPLNPDDNDVYFFYRYQNGHPVLNVQSETDATERGTQRPLRREDLALEQSVLSQIKDPDQYPEITYLGNQFSKFKLYREWDFGRKTPPRVPQKADLPEDFLSEDASNLGLVLNNMQYQAGAKEAVLERLKQLYDRTEGITTKIQMGTVQLFLHETDFDDPIPATRLSDGMLRFLCLLSILCHPSPPPLVCLEEPELGLHPDVLGILAELLIEASQRTQLIVTTHSDILVSALSDVPESVLVCEREAEGTSLRRLDNESLTKWLHDYSLGDLWLMGELGGTK